MRRRSRPGDERKRKQPETLPANSCTLAGAAAVDEAPPNRLQQLEELATSTTNYSPEIQEMLQQERINQSMRLSNAWLQSLQAGGHGLGAPGLVSAPLVVQNQMNLPSALAVHPTWQHAAVAYAAPTYFHPAPYPFSLYQALNPQPWQAVPMAYPHYVSSSIWQQRQGTSSEPPLQQYQHQIHQQFESVNTSMVATAPHIKLASSTAATFPAAEASKNSLTASVSKASTKSNRSYAPAAATRSKPNCTLPLVTQASLALSEPPSPMPSLETTARRSTATGGAYLQCVKRRRYRTETFPNKLLRMIETAKREGQQHLISFTSDGSSIQMPSPKELTEEVFPKYFRHTNFASFQRQLSMYGFLRIIQGENKGAYAHPLFIEGQPELIHEMKRISELELIEGPESLRDSIETDEQTAGQSAGDT